MQALSNFIESNKQFPLMTKFSVRQIYTTSKDYLSVIPKFRNDFRNIIGVYNSLSYEVLNVKCNNKN